jgi:4-hydroxybenzoate polyprenyltransferase
MSVNRVTSPLAVLQVVVREIRPAHTFFALPFAYVGAIFAARGFPHVRDLFWITIAVLGARTAAMAANRYFDRDIDKRNPRTARRALATGEIDANVMLFTAIAGIVLLLLGAAELNPLCVRLLPLAALGILAYPFCKRFTWGTHFVLGAVDGLAPLGAYIGVSGRVDASALLLFAGVTIWVAGFDIIYALMDRDIDVAQNISSLPARFGSKSGRRVPLILHVALAAVLAWAGALEGAAPIFFLGALFPLVLAFYENSQFDRAENVFVLNERVFVSNMVFSLAFLGITYAGFASTI